MWHSLFGFQDFAKLLRKRSRMRDKTVVAPWEVFNSFSKPIGERDCASMGQNRPRSSVYSNCNLRRRCLQRYEVQPVEADCRSIMRKERLLPSSRAFSFPIAPAPSRVPPDIEIPFNKSGFIFEERIESENGFAKKRNLHAPRLFQNDASVLKIRYCRPERRPMGDLACFNLSGLSARPDESPACKLSAGALSRKRGRCISESIQAHASPPRRPRSSTGSIPPPSPDFECVEKRRSLGSRESCGITDLERPQSDNQTFFNGFSKQIKRDLRVDLADRVRTFAEPLSCRA